ncbi:MAG: hypothetical protein ACK559_04680, partial [bacterium]
ARLIPRDHPRQPAALQRLVGIGRGIPDFDRAEVRQIGLRIADTAQHGQFARIPGVAQGCERRVDGQPGGQLQPGIIG